MNPTTSEICDAIRSAELFPASELKRAQADFKHEDPDDGKAFVEFLVSSQRLTRWQGKFLFQGKADQIAIGSYVLLEKIGQGGMGVVFKGRHRTMDRLVAVKTVDAKRFKNKEVLIRFQREVKAAARLVHPNIVTAFDAGETRGFHYLVMEFTEGSDLYSLVKQDGPLSQTRSVELVLQAARALEHAHAKGIVHRDVKPNNLLLDKTGQVKLLDLGLAQFSRGESDPNELTAFATAAGQIMGTVDFMSPEQGQDSSAVDHRADIYSLGCTLYYLSQGRPVYERDSPMKRLIAHARDPIPVLPKEIDGPAGLNKVFQTMLAKEPSDRFATMSETIKALEGTLTPETNRASPRARSPIDAIVEEFDLQHTIGDDIKPANRQVRSKVRKSKKPQSQGLGGSSDMTLPWVERPVAWYRRISSRQWLIGGFATVAMVGISFAVAWSLWQETDSNTEIPATMVETEPPPANVTESELPETPTVKLPRPKNIQAERTIGL